LGFVKSIPDGHQGVGGAAREQGLDVAGADLQALGVSHGQRVQKTWVNVVGTSLGDFLLIFCEKRQFS
jgi:hypothetical protein